MYVQYMYGTLCPYVHLDNSGSDSRNLIGQLQVSKRGRNLERDSKCQWGRFYILLTKAINNTPRDIAYHPVHKCVSAPGT